MSRSVMPLGSIPYRHLTIKRLLFLPSRYRSDFHRRNVPKKDLSPKILNGDGPGVAAALSVDWGAEMTGLHREYQTWGYFDPFRELPKSFNSRWDIDFCFYGRAYPCFSCALLVRLAGRDEMCLLAAKYMGL